MASGERYSVLYGEESLEPNFYPTLFITTQVRNRSKSHATMKAALADIAVLREFMRSRGQDEVARFAKAEFLRPDELDALRDFCQLRVGSRRADSRKGAGFVANATLYTRLSTIAEYVGWLVPTILPNFGTDVREAVDATVEAIKARRPWIRGNKHSAEEKFLTEEQTTALVDAFHPDSPSNPFTDEGVQVRNWIAFLILYYLGLRAGELLNIRVSDIDFAASELAIVRRPDSHGDLRTDQPLVKTGERSLPLSPSLAMLIHSYVMTLRRAVPNARRHDYLFVVHRPGRALGNPLSRSALSKLFQQAIATHRCLSGVTPHTLRHDWNYRFSCTLDRMDLPLSTSEEEKLRSYLMGWREGSSSSAIYNRRFIRKSAYEAAIRLQELLLHDN